MFNKIKRSLQMFQTKEIKKTDKSYFSIILAENYDLTIQLKNMGRIWYIRNPDYPEKGECIIFHNHKASRPYHQHSRGKSLRQKVEDIKRHDVFQMNERK